MIHKMIEAVAVAGTIAGLYFVSEGNANGFSIGAIANIFWVWHGYNLTSGGTGIIIVNVILLFINLNGMGVI